VGARIPSKLVMRVRFCQPLDSLSRSHPALSTAPGPVFARLDCKPRWRERLAELAMPALVVHGRRDPFFPVGNGEALAREIPGARLLVLERASTAIPRCGRR
jgi:pimeloyl-ACP methyl ester carboxylesterase